MASLLGWKRNETHNLLLTARRFSTTGSFQACRLSGLLKESPILAFLRTVQFQVQRVANGGKGWERVGKGGSGARFPLAYSYSWRFNRIARPYETISSLLFVCDRVVLRDSLSLSLSLSLSRCFFIRLFVVCGISSLEKIDGRGIPYRQQT